MESKDKKEFKNNLILFINECMCRRESNQHKANKLWEVIKPHIKLEDVNLFELEWKGHYVNTKELAPSGMSYFINTALKPYLND